MYVTKNKISKNLKKSTERGIIPEGYRGASSSGLEVLVSGKPKSQEAVGPLTLELDIPEIEY